MAFGLGSLIGPAIGLAGSFMGARGKNNPGQAGMQQLQNVPQYGYNAYNPFIARGAEAETQAFPQHLGMTNYPTDFLHNIESQYKESPGYAFRKSQLLKDAGNTAAAGGFLGTENDVNNRTSLVNSLLGGDIQQYIQNVLGIHGRGLSGLDQRVGRGYEASGGLADYLGGAQGARAGYGSYGRAYGNEANSNVYNALSNLINVGMGSGRGMGGGGFMGGY